jgi:hypothetical protein
VENAHWENAQIMFTADPDTAAALSEALVESGALIKALAPTTVTLEDLFFSLTEGTNRDPPARRADAKVGT